MILVFGGTTEGKAAVRVLEGASQKYYYSTQGPRQLVECTNAIRLTGGMDAKEIESFCRKNEIHLLVDAAHPFAVLLHKNIEVVSEKLGLPVVRYERTYPTRDPAFVWCDTFQEVLDYLEAQHIECLLALTGVKTVSGLRDYWERHTCWFRILDREESVALASEVGFPLQNLLYYEEGEDVEEMVRRLKPEAILVKESGHSGFFEEKVKAAQKAGVTVIVVKRPRLSETFYVVRGEHGFRHAVERLCPGFFPLKSGYTTGSCACAAAKAACQTLLTGKQVEACQITLPCGEEVSIPIAATSVKGQQVTCSVIKDAGDDPDVTNGCEIRVTVTFNGQNEICFLAGEGMGIVTLPGLGLKIGEPAINPTPRRMISEEIGKLLNEYEEERGVNVMVSVPGGKELAEKTFNPKLGITGGISIIGTSGIVLPFSSEAFIQTIRKEIQVAKAMGCRRLVINSGAKSERILKEHLPECLPQAFIHYGNYIGETLKIADEEDIPEVIMGIMIGKAVKLAEGHMDTHSRRVVMNRQFILDLACKSNCSQEVCDRIQQITLARELWEVLPHGHLFFKLLMGKCQEVCRPYFSGHLELLLIPEDSSKN